MTSEVGEDWQPIHLAPRDGTPVILWTIEADIPPAIPEPVGFWTVDLTAGVGYWRLFGEPPRACLDRQIRRWKPLLRD